MIGQELFEHPRRQYPLFGITPQDELRAVVESPNLLESDFLTEEQIEAVEKVLDDNPDNVLTFDPDEDVWITGPEEEIEKMFAQREAFVEALISGEDPGI
ncbi:protein GrpE [Corynebacterium phocae]|uniref:Protein GrpE n=1 Tax=Corynebacterium phocae TaxID=161895 RepID=A0A1L7D3T9_9CORY|nr:molecular chaperone GrpE [Corynebacterium phocae]APT92788.1 protein GrpE [Corynebacterium phocae]KAA8723102.1 molecular chaperone GrpE [Corynebacterium phocae]